MDLPFFASVSSEMFGFDPLANCIVFPWLADLDSELATCYHTPSLIHFNHENKLDYLKLAVKIVLKHIHRWRWSILSQSKTSNPIGTGLWGSIWMLWVDREIFVPRLHTHFKFCSSNCRIIPKTAIGCWSDFSCLCNVGSYFRKLACALPYFELNWKKFSA